MSWIKLGVRWQPIYDKSKKLLAWSEGLRTELGFGFTQFIATSDGSQFVLSEEDKKIRQLIYNKSLDYLYKVDELNSEIEDLLKSDQINLAEVIERSLKQMSYFYIANEIAELKYNDENKELIEKWRNDPDHFTGDDKVLSVIANELGVLPELVELMMVDEVREVLESKELNKAEIQKRADTTWSLVLEDSQIKLYLEDKSPIQDQIGDLKEIKGKSVFESNQKIVGIVGKDIMVTSMTHPDMVSKMKKMKVIITDEGGVLSHAAITCREFKIPGIIGTKVATKVLKKGDNIEVDLSNGLVKII